jgi:hypothetical protein
MDTSRELLEKLKAVREARGISYQKIADLTEAAGNPVSLSTIKRVFSADAERANFRYETTIQPIVKAVLDDKEKPEGANDLEIAITENDAMRVIIRAKNELIDNLQMRLDEKTAQIAEANKTIKHKNRVELLHVVAIVCMLVIGSLFYMAHSCSDWLWV